MGYRDFSYENFDHTINGKHYQVVVDNVGDDDCDKRWTKVKKPDGTSVHIDWSPYHSFSRHDLELMVKLDFPTRETLKQRGSITSTDLQRYYQEYLNSGY